MSADTFQELWRAMPEEITASPLTFHLEADYRRRMMWEAACVQFEPGLYCPIRHPVWYEAGWVDGQPFQASWDCPVAATANRDPIETADIPEHHKAFYRNLFDDNHVNNKVMDVKGKQQEEKRPAWFKRPTLYRPSSAKGHGVSLSVNEADFTSMFGCFHPRTNTVGSSDGSGKLTPSEGSSMPRSASFSAISQSSRSNSAFDFLFEDSAEI